MAVYSFLGYPLGLPVCTPLHQVHSEYSTAEEFLSYRHSNCLKEMKTLMLTHIYCSFNTNAVTTVLILTLVVIRWQLRVAIRNFGGCGCS